MFADLSDHDLALKCVRAYNDFIIDEWCAAAPGRYIPMIIIPFGIPDWPWRRRYGAPAKGAKAIAFSENLHPLGFPSIHSGVWDNFFAAANETKMPLCTHIGSSSVVPYVARRAVRGSGGKHQPQSGALNHGLAVFGQAAEVPGPESCWQKAASAGSPS